MISVGPSRGEALGAAAGLLTRRRTANDAPSEHETEDRVLWLRLLTEGSRWSFAGVGFSGLLLAGGGVCYALTTSKPAGAKLARAWMSLGRGIVRACRWGPAAIAAEYPAKGEGGTVLGRLESEFGRSARAALEGRLQQVLNEYHPECASCDVRMYRDHTYARSFMTRHGEVRLTVTVLQCPECDMMASGMDVLGQETGRVSAENR